MEQPRPTQGLSAPAPAPPHSLLPGDFRNLSVLAPSVRPVVPPNTSLGAPTPLGLQGTHNRTFLPPTYCHIGNRWREIQGANDWEGLKDPLDECLRSELIRYGQFAEVAYDAFDFDKYSQYCGSCRYSKDNLFEEVDLHNSGYTVTMYVTPLLNLPFSAISCTS